MQLAYRWAVSVDWRKAVAWQEDRMALTPSQASSVSVARESGTGAAQEKDLAVVAAGPAPALVSAESASLLRAKRDRPSAELLDATHGQPKKRVAAAANRLAAAVSAVERKKDAVQVVRNPKTSVSKFKLPKQWTKAKRKPYTKNNNRKKVSSLDQQNRKKKKQAKATTRKKRKKAGNAPASGAQAKARAGKRPARGGSGRGKQDGFFFPENQPAHSKVAKPASPFDFFCMETRQLIEGRMPDVTPAKVSRLLSTAFRSLSEADKLPFFAKAEGDRLRHIREHGESTLLISYAF